MAFGFGLGCCSYSSDNGFCGTAAKPEDRKFSVPTAEIMWDFMKDGAPCPQGHLAKSAVNEGIGGEGGIRTDPLTG